MSKRKCKLSVFEIVWYSICGALALWGLTYVILGTCARLLVDSDLNSANKVIAKTFGLGFLGWGLIIIAIAAVAAIIVLCSYAKKTDKEFEKAQRRAARLSAMQQSDSDVVDLVNVSTESTDASQGQ